MNEQAYKRFYERVGELNGWDFSKVRCVSEGVEWDFFHEVSRSCKKSDLLLDIGTGGGEALLSIADAAHLLVGIDQSSAMMNTANSNLEKSGKGNVRFLQMDAETLDFPGKFFDVIACRHSPFRAEEVARVLHDDGLFLTQQVSEADKLNLKQAFGRGQSFGVPDGTLKNKFVSELHEVCFSDVRFYEYNATEYYASYEDLVYLLKHAPIIPDFGKEANDFAVLDGFIKENRTAAGIRTNSKRFMIAAKK